MNQYNKVMNICGLRNTALVSCIMNSILLHVWNYLPPHYLFARLVFIWFSL